MSKAPRLSNFELLRIYAIFMVLVFHSNIHTLGIPTSETVLNKPFEAFGLFSVQGISVICVNVFILLSGWFGIRPTLKGVFKLLYQVLFFLLGGYIVAILLGKASFSLNSIAWCFLLDDYAWFVKSYICLMILAPLLNSFSQNASKREYEGLLISFYIFQSIYGWATNAASFFNYGSSVVSFCGLYLIAQYIRRFQPRWSQYKSYIDLLIYLGIVVFCAIFLVSISPISEFSSIYHSLVGHMYSYSSPLVIVECVFLFLFFSKLKLQSTIINFIAASCFSVLFVHGNPYIFPYQEKVLDAYANNTYLIALGKVLLICAEAFILAIILDQLRKLTWEGVVKIFTMKTKCENENS